eukprot:EG_transcript_64401
MSPDGGEEAVEEEMAAGREVGMVLETPQAEQADHPMLAASSELPPAPVVPPETAPPAAASEAAGQAGVAEEAPKPLARKGGPEGSGEAAEGGASAAKRIKL